MCGWIVDGFLPNWVISHDTANVVLELSTATAWHGRVVVVVRGREKQVKNENYSVALVELRDSISFVIDGKKTGGI
jgi:hypothetical protein